MAESSRPPHVARSRHCTILTDYQAALTPMRWSNPVIFKIDVGLENPELNLTLRSGPSDYTSARHFHWYVSVIPRLTRAVGFELGSGMFINTVLPEAGRVISL
jgi:hypothetical protein